jgi:hypothetical protein
VNISKKILFPDFFNHIFREITHIEKYLDRSKFFAVEFALRLSKDNHKASLDLILKKSLRVSIASISDAKMKIITLGHVYALVIPLSQG